MTKKDSRQQNSERRLRHARWAVEPGIPWPTVLFMTGVAALIGWWLAAGRS